MAKDIFVYLPDYRGLITFYSLIVAILIAINIYFLLKHGGVLLYVPLVLLSFLFLFLFVPVLRNPMLIIHGNEIRISSFGKWYTISFTKDLRAIVLKDNEVLSYKFESDGIYYQISPESYIESDEVEQRFSKLLKRYNGTFKVINK